MKHSFYRRGGKRVLDLIVAAALLLLLAPVLAAVAAVVRVWFGSPVLFRQVRPGYRGRRFTLYKFRTMTDVQDAQGRLLPDEARMTRWSRLLRATSLDELPELWNVLRGEMSLVGPRPLLVEYLERYSPEQARRHNVRPGITGWAQTNGRNAIDWDTKLALDVWYVDHQSLWLDVKILLLTVIQVLGRQGITAAGHATAPEFQGNAKKTACADIYGDHGSEEDEAVVVIGGGGHVKVVVSTLQAAGHRVAGIVDNDPSKWNQRILGIPVESESSLERYQGRRAVIALGDGASREKIARRFDLHWITVVHPRAIVDPSVELGEGTVVFAGAVIQPDARVGEHVIVNTGATIDHDSTVGDFSHIAPGAHLAGHVHLGRHALLGIGSSVIPGITIGENTTIGAGAAVVADVPKDCVAVGCPARVVRTKTGRSEAA